MPFRFFPEKTHFKFMEKRWIGFAVSIALTIGALGMLATKGLNYGIDFTGGVLMEARTPQEADLGAMRDALSDQGFGEISLQNFGEPQDVIIRIQSAETDNQAEVAARVKSILSEAFPGIEYRKLDYVGPTVGKELMRDGMLAVSFAFLAILIYVWFRFEWQYGFGSILALLHDSVMILGFFAVTRFEFGLTAIAALMTIVGYSINDTVVIYDRIRENMRKFKKMPVSQLLNISINETLSRTFLTASTVLLASLSLALFGGEVLEGFSWAIVFGTVVGTYSSVYISAPALIYLNIRPDNEQPEPESKAVAG